MPLSKRASVLERLIRVGDFERALRALGKGPADGRFTVVRRMRSGSARRARAAGALAELAFYRGENDEGRTLVKLAAPRRILLNGLKGQIPVRVR